MERGVCGRREDGIPARVCGASSSSDVPEWRFIDVIGKVRAASHSCLACCPKILSDRNRLLFEGENNSFSTISALFLLMN